MKGIFNGVLNCTHCNFSLNRQNNKFQQKGLIIYSKKGVKRKAPTHRDGAFQHNFYGLRSI